MIETAMVTAIVLVASTAQTVAGFGFALIGMPLLMNHRRERDEDDRVPHTSRDGPAAEQKPACDQRRHGVRRGSGIP